MCSLCAGPSLPAGQPPPTDAAVFDRIVSFCHPTRAPFPIVRRSGSHMFRRFHAVPAFHRFRDVFPVHRLSSVPCVTPRSTSDHPLLRLPPPLFADVPWSLTFPRFSLVQRVSLTSQMFPRFPDVPSVPTRSSRVRSRSPHVRRRIRRCPGVPAVPRRSAGYRTFPGSSTFPPFLRFLIPSPPSRTFFQRMNMFPAAFRWFLTVSPFPWRSRSSPTAVLELSL